jgi:hypothetical protein
MPSRMVTTLTIRSVPNKTQDPKGHYSSNTYTDKLLEYFDSRTEEERAKPFFSFLPFTAPHWPLQCPKTVLEKCGSQLACTSSSFLTTSQVQGNVR